MPSRFICVFGNVRIFSFLWLNNIPLCIYISISRSRYRHTSQLLYPFIYWGCLGCVHVLAIVNNFTMSMVIQIFFQLLFSLPLDIFTEVEWLDHMVVLVFNFLRNHHTVFHGGSNNLHFHQHCIRVPNHHLLFLFFLCVMAILRCGLMSIVVLICISLMTRNVECLFMRLLLAGNF